MNRNMQHKDHVPNSPLYVPGRPSYHDYPEQQQSYDQRPYYQSPRRDLFVDPRVGSAKGQRNTGRTNMQAESPHPPEWLAKKLAEKDIRHTNNQLSSLFSSNMDGVTPPILTHRQQQNGPLQKDNLRNSRPTLADIGHHQHVPNTPIYRPGALPPKPSEAAPLWQSPNTPIYRPGALPPKSSEAAPLWQSPYTERSKQATPVASLENKVEEDIHQPRPTTKHDHGMDIVEKDIREQIPFGDGPGYSDHMKSSQIPYPRANQNMSEHMQDPRLSWRSNHVSPNIRGAGKNRGALLFIRFPTGLGPKGENILVAEQAFQRAKLNDLHGQYLGLAEKIYDFGYASATKDAMGVFHFPSMENAKLFFQLDSRLRQPDFPPPYGHCQMWIVCNAYRPDNIDSYDTFLLSEIKLDFGTTKRQEYEEYQERFAQYLSKKGALPFVVCSYGSDTRTSLRRHSYNAEHVVTCHLFKDPSHLINTTQDEEYEQYTSRHNQMALEQCSIFTLSRSIMK